MEDDETSVLHRTPALPRRAAITTFNTSRSNRFLRMEASAHGATLLAGYKSVELRPGLYSIDVLGDRVQSGTTNSEWRRLGELLAERLVVRQQSAVLVSAENLEHYLVDGSESSTADNSTDFEHEGKRYLVTALQPTRLEHTLPEIVESEEFVFGLNAWLCFFAGPQSARQLCLAEEDTTFVRQMKSVISNLSVLDEVDLTLELIAAVSDGCELLWFNPRR